MCQAWVVGAQSRIGLAVGLDVVMVHEGFAAFIALASDQDDGVVLFTDLHAGNVLASHRQPWLAIDPKPYVGDPTYDALQHLLNGPRIHTDPLALSNHMAALLDLDAARLRLWLFARCCVAAVDDPQMHAVARLVAP